MPRRNYGPRGCALSLALLAVIVAVLYLAMRWIESSGPTDAQIRTWTGTLIEQAWEDRGVSDIEITEVFAQRERLHWRSTRWAIKGRARVRPEPNQSVDELFHASVRTVCDGFDDRMCWTLDSLTTVQGD